MPIIRHMARFVGVVVSTASVSDRNLYGDTKVIEHRYHVAQTAAQPIERSNRERVTSLKRF